MLLDARTPDVVFPFAEPLNDLSDEGGLGSRDLVDGKGLRRPLSNTPVDPSPPLFARSMDSDGTSFERFIADLRIGFGRVGGGGAASELAGKANWDFIDMLGRRGLWGEGWRIASGGGTMSRGGGVEGLEGGNDGNGT